MRETLLETFGYFIGPALLFIFAVSTTLYRWMKN